jgi:hypothetical protein
MTGTIREYVERRQRLSHWLLTAACVLALVPLAFVVRMTRGVFPEHPHPYLHAYLVAFSASLALTCIAMTVETRTKCPKCTKQLVVPTLFGTEAN